MVGSVVNLRQPWELSTLADDRLRALDEMGQSPSSDAIPTVGLESTGLTDRTDTMPKTDFVAIDATFDQDSGREAR